MEKVVKNCEKWTCTKITHTGVWPYQCKTCGKYDNVVLSIPSHQSRFHKSHIVDMSLWTSKYHNTFAAAAKCQIIKRVIDVEGLNAMNGTKDSNHNGLCFALGFYPTALSRLQNNYCPFKKKRS